MNDVHVILADLGGPATDAEVAPFLRSFLADPAVIPLPAPLRGVVPPLAAALRAPKVAARYRAVGGSPVVAAVTALAARLEAALGLPVHGAFRHSSPRIEEVVSAAVQAGARTLVALPTFLQECGSTTDNVHRAVVAAAPPGVDVRPARPDPADPDRIAALAAGVAPLVEAGTHLLLVAHGLPLRQVRRGDPYVAQVERTAAALAARFDGVPWSLAWQSRVGPGAWTAPSVEDELARLAAAGNRDLVLVPVSFATENLETLWDLDRVARDRALTLGMTCRRSPAPAEHPALVRALAREVRTVLALEAAS